MSDAPGSASNPLRVAVIGSGPSGFYACEELLKQEQPAVTVDLYDRLPTPYGLVRGGVAPDHQKIKSVIRLYERTANRPGFRFFGNVSYGKDVTLDDLRAHYHQVLFSTGAETDRRMGIPGEDLPGSFPATEFVGWYNGHPDYRHLEFDLSAESVAIVGVGNVAMDVARILAKPIEELALTDIADYALAALRTSKVRTIHMLGRRGPAQAAFTNPEIRELCSLDGCDLVLQPDELRLDEHSLAFLEQVKDPTHQRNVDIMQAHLEQGPGSQGRKLHLRFLVSPTEVLGQGKTEGLRLERNTLLQDESGTVRPQGTGQTEEIAVQLVFRSIGYRGVALPELPFDERSGTLPNTDGRILDPASSAPLPRLYTAGWIKRGPSGVIGTNKPDAIATVRAMLEDAGAANFGENLAAAAGSGFDPDPEAVSRMLAERGVRVVTFADWKRLDALEVERGEAVGKPREKFTQVADMLAALD